MRIRQVKPDFWRDSVMTELTDTVRLVYIGLWMEADDAGYIRLDTSEIARDLWDAPKSEREARLCESLDMLVKVRRVVLLECGKHATIPTLVEHQRLAAPDKRVHTVQREHARECAPSPQVPADARVSPARNGNGKEGEGKGRGGVGGDGSAVTDDQDRETTGSTEFQRLVPRPMSASGVH